jgi:two-component system OmpR family response regulator
MQSTKCRILYVDDHEDTSFMLTHLLAQSHYEVTTASCMADALETIKNKGFDLYVLDKRLPDGSGLDLCRTLHEMTPQIPVIFYSGDAYELHRHEGLSAGADAYVTKPNIEELIEKVHQFLGEGDCSAAVVEPPCVFR